ncbi:IS66 family transposase zinc-finger binding domain-containing protein [Fluoribacter gormanii]|uniref:IS66 family transposase zinc-finger binding domain-containing protein n=1 Tax=Fluoribacter gormanii TaxID=464 RepID=UPI0039089622
MRENGKHKNGGHKGHKSTTLKQVVHADHGVRHKLEECPDCGRSLAKQAAQGIIKRQVFDLPIVQVEVTEHRAEMKFCSCCQKQVTASFPSEVKAHTQYGNRVRSWIVYYQNQHLIPEDRIQHRKIRQQIVQLNRKSICIRNHTFTFWLTNTIMFYILALPMI